MKNGLVRDFMSLSPVFVYEKSSVANALETVKNLKIDNIPVVKDDFSLVGFVSKKKLVQKLNLPGGFKSLKNEPITDLIEKLNSPVILYPRMNATEALSIMKFLGVNGLPVVELPWEKRMIGFLWIDDVWQINKPDYIKMTV